MINATTGQSFNINFDEDEVYYGYYGINFHTPPHNKKEEMIQALATGKPLRVLEREYGLNRGTMAKMIKGEPIYEKGHHLKKKTT